MSVQAQDQVECRVLTFDRHPQDTHLLYSTDPKAEKLSTVKLEKNNFSDPFLVDRALLKF